MNDVNAAPAPLISIVTPVYNGSRYIEELILSVRGQTLQDFEHIVIDDGSTDDGATVGILSRFPHLRWWTRPNKGQYETLNEGIAAARGKLVCIVSADDVLHSAEVFTKVAEAWAGEPGLDALYGRTELMDKHGAAVQGQAGRPDESYPRRINFYFLLIHHCSMFVRREFLAAHRISFDGSLRYTGDWDWVIRILKLGRTRFIDLPVSRYRVHEQQTRQTSQRAALTAEDRIVLRRHGSSYLFHRILINYFRVQKAACVLLREGPQSLLKDTRRFLARRS